MFSKIWNWMKKVGRAYTEAQQARAEWEVARHLEMQGYKNLNEYQREKLKYYGRSYF